MNIAYDSNASFSITSPSGTLLFNPSEVARVNDSGDGALIWAYTSEGQHRLSASEPPTRALVVEDPGEYGVGEVSIRGHANSYAADDDIHAVDIVYGIDLQDIRLCVIGSIGAIPTGQPFEDIGGSQVVLVDTDLSRLDDGELARLLRTLEPKTIVARGASAERLAGELAIKEFQRASKVTLAARSLGDEKMSFCLLVEKS